MKKSEKLIKKINLLIFIISEIICFFIMKTNIISYAKNNVYYLGISIVQFLYFLPMFTSTLYIFFCKNSDSTKFIHVTIGLMIYSVFLHFFIRQIASLFISTNGIINFVGYVSKIYFICLPLVGFKILAIKKEENIEKVLFLLWIRIILLVIIIFLFKNLFALKGVLYSWSLNEFIIIFLFWVKYRKNTLA